MTFNDVWSAIYGCGSYDKCVMRLYLMGGRSFVRREDFAMLCSDDFKWETLCVAVCNDISLGNFDMPETASVAYAFGAEMVE